MFAFHAELMARIVLGTLLGGVIGYERDLRGRSAGLRTHTIVALASTTFMVVSTRFVYFQHYAPGDLVEVDPSRIAASVVSGIGFLGAGAILRTGITIQGLTTAAGLWLVAAIGMAAGGGMYAESVFVTLVGLAGLTLLRRFEDRGTKIARRRLTLVIDETLSPLQGVVDALTKAGAVVSQEEYERRLDEGETRITFDVRTPMSIKSDELARALVSSSTGIRHVRLESI